MTDLEYLEQSIYYLLYHLEETNLLEREFYLMRAQVLKDKNKLSGMLPDEIRDVEMNIRLLKAHINFVKRRAGESVCLSDRIIYGKP